MNNTEKNKPSTPQPVIGRRGPGGPVEKPKNFKESMGKLLNYIKSYNKVMILAVVLAIISSSFSLFGPSKLSEITDIVVDGMEGEVYNELADMSQEELIEFATQNDIDISSLNADIDTTGIDIEAISNIAIFLVVIYISSLIIGYTQGNIMATVSQKISRKLRGELVVKINKLPLSYFDKTSYGDTLSRLTNDVDTIATSLNQSMASLISGVFMLVGSLTLMFFTNWIMALAGVLSTLMGFVLMKAIITNSQKFFKQQQGELGKLNGQIEEVYTGHEIVKAYNAENYYQNLFSKQNQKLQKSAWKAQYISGLMMPIMGFVGNFSYLVVCITGAILVMNDVITFGVIVAFMVYIRLFTQPLTTLAQAATTLQSAAAASERVFALIEEDELSEETNKSSYKEKVKGDVEFKDVYFGYSKDKMIVKGFSTEIKAGQKVAIVGPTGAGKTTIVNLLMRFYEVDSGEISIDNVNISDMKREDLHELFAMVLQDTWMFEGTIKENIKYSVQNVTDEEIIDVCKSVGIHHTIMSMPKGYDTDMSSSALSVGEKQLITIARAMVKKSELLILDEATSSVDTRTEILIQNALDNLSKDKTSFIIAHRLSTIKNADLILVMKDGNIIESGNHEKLLNENGFYAELYNSQFEETN